MVSVFGKKDFNNAKWFVVEKIVALIVSIFIVPKIFSSLGADNIGGLEYVKSVLGIFAPILSLGLSAICVREFVFYPKRANIILITSVVLQFTVWLFLFLCLIVYLRYFEISKLFWIYVIVSFSYLLRISSVFEYYLQAIKEVKYVFATKIFTLFIIMFLQYYGIKNNFGVLYFAQLICCEFGFYVILYFLIYTRVFKKKMNLFAFSPVMAIRLIRSSFPLILSNLLIAFYVSIDELFLEHYHSDYEVGIFASVQFLVMGLCWSIGFSLINGLYPSIAESYFSKSKSEYKRKIFILSIFVTILGLLIGMLYFVFGDYVLERFFTPEYRDARLSLKIFCWAPLFVFLGMIYEKHIVNTNELYKNVLRFIIGILVNIILCFILIPRWSVNGAAISVLLSHFVVNVMFVSVDYVFTNKCKIER